MTDTAGTEALLGRCLELVGQYEVRISAKRPPRYDPRVIPEFRDRLKALGATYRKIVALVGPAMDASTGLFGMQIDEDAAQITIDLSRTFLNPKAVEEKEQLDMEIFGLTESFYNIAWRLREILNSRHCGLPGLCGFDSPGVRNVRNQIMQHPERIAGVNRLWSRGLSKRQGPTLGGAYEGSPAPVFVDHGLYSNAREFAERLEARLTTAITSVCS